MLWCAVLSAFSGRRRSDAPISGWQHEPVPELPEVEALAQFLRGRAVDHTVTSVEIGAISALKTFRPPPDALRGGVVVDVQRHGKWVDLMVATPTGEPLHLVWHLSRAGWVRWSEQLSERPVRPGKSPIALRVRFDDGAGFDLTEAGTRKRLAVHVVEDPQTVPQIATLGVEPLSPEFTQERLTELLGARKQQLKGLLRDQGTIAGIGNAYSDEILLVARMSPFAMTTSLDAERTATLYARHPGRADRGGGRRVRQARGRAQGRQAPGDARARANGRAVPGMGRRPVRRHGARGVVRRLRAAVLPDVPDRRQAAGGPTDVPAAALGA